MSYTYGYVQAYIQVMLSEFMVLMITFLHYR
jgi:hypothetical protein